MIKDLRQRAPYGNHNNILSSFKFSLNYQKVWHASRGCFTTCSKIGCETPSFFLLAVIVGFQKYKCPCVCKEHLYEAVKFFHPKKVFVYRLKD